MTTFIICGESSANAYGIQLAKALDQLGETVVMAGGDAIDATSIHRILRIDPAQHSVAFGQWAKKRALIGRLRQAIEGYHAPINRAVIIDFPGMNFLIASCLSALNIPISTFITPNFWIWKNRRLANQLVAYSRHIIAIHKPEYDVYKALAPQKTHYWGHPMTKNNNGIIPKNRTPRRTIGLFPGSRLHEIQHILPVMMAVADHLIRQGARPVILCDEPALQSVIQAKIPAKYARDIPVMAAHEASLDGAITAAGTVTLRLALSRIPMVIVGRVQPWVYAVARYVLRMKVPAIGLPNILLNQSVFPEFVQPSISDSVAIASAMNGLLDDPQKSGYDSAFHALAGQLNAPDDYYDRVARLVLGDG